MERETSKEFVGQKILKRILIRYLKESLTRRLNMVDMIMAYLKGNKDEIIDGLNKKVNIPLISEAKEEEIFDSLFDGFMEVLEGVLSKKK